ncbi:MAG: glucokinase [Desulfomonile tiedjei]|nr:glucokinase [Desulfomonile tiedjei]
MVLAGDIGGTKTRLGLFSCTERLPQALAIESYSSQVASGLEEMIAHFLSRHDGPISAACFGIAGPVIDGRCKVTNLAWEASEEEIRRQFTWKNVHLINDLSATGLAIPLLDDADLFPLNPAGPEPRGTVGLVAPGTGLGISLLVRQDGRLIPIPSEGGHVDFAPRTEEEFELWRYLRRDRDHVSVEQIVSGPGILAIYSWLKEREEHEEPEWLRDKMELVEPPIAISEAAVQEREPLCVETLNYFVSILGATAGNVALTGMTTGGMYLGGGICPKILPKLQENIFMEAFTDKGRFRDLLSGMAIRVILDDKAALLGAAWCACQ